MSLKEIQEKLDLNKKLNGYFNKAIFRSCVVVLILFTVFTLWSNGWEYRFIYAENPTSQLKLNPFYVCDNSTTKLELILTPLSDCIPEPIPKVLKPICEAGGCKQYLEPYEIVGNKPNFLAKYYNAFSMLFVALAFIINHLVMRGKLKNES